VRKINIQRKKGKGEIPNRRSSGCAKEKRGKGACRVEGTTIPGQSFSGGKREKRKGKGGKHWSMIMNKLFSSSFFSVTEKRGEEKEGKRVARRAQ